MAIKIGKWVRVVNSGTSTMVLTCLLGIASYFFGQPAAYELHWFWMALGSTCIVVLAIIQFVHARRIRRRDDELLAVLEAVPHILFFKDTASRYRVVNSEFERGFGLDRNTAVGSGDIEIFGPELGASFITQDKDLMSSGKAQSFENVIMINGALRNIQSRKQPVYDRHGKLRGIVGVVLDVTEEIKLQRQLEDAHDRLSIALEVARLGTWELHVSTGELQLSPRSRQVLGMKDDEHDLSAAFTRVHPDDEANVRLCLKQARTQQEAVTYVFRIVDDSGSIRWVEGVSAPNRARGGDHMIGVNRDITERRINELALAESKRQADQVLVDLKQSQSQLALALGIGGLGVWRSFTRLGKGTRLTSREIINTVIAVDPKIRETFGLGAKTNIRYRELCRLLDPADRARVTANFGLVYRNGISVYRDQFRIRACDGVMRTVTVRGSVTQEVEMGTGEMRLLFTGIAKDITKEEALKNELIAKAEEARSALEAKRQFLAMMSHEVRTPLTGVLGMIDLTLDTPLTDTQRSMLLRSRESSESLLSIINGILDFSKIEARKLEIENRPLSLSGLVEAVCMTLRPEVMRKAIGLDFTIDPEIPEFILGDSLRLRQVLTNLAGNAVKFTRQGCVTIVADLGAGNVLRLIVEDTGLGISPETIKTIFQPFKQADIATTRRFGGTGLGLTIVKQLVELMHGSVHCKSEPGVGSRFVVTLPLQPWIPCVDVMPAKPPVERPAMELGEIFGGGRRLLLAEDHQINREVITMQLDKLGFECDIAEDGEAAWERLRAPGAHYAMLLTDCHMPRLNGYDLTTRLRAHEAAIGLPRLPIVALTANALQGERERCLALGMDGYLSKPLRLDDLRQVLAEALRASERAAPSESVTEQVTLTESVTAYPGLTELCSGRLDKVAGLVHIFVGATVDDLKAMDRAVAAGNEDWLRELAHRLSSACHQLDELKAVAALKAVEYADVPQALFTQARNELSLALARASAFVDLHSAKPTAGASLSKK